MDPNRTTRPLIWVGFGYDFNPPKKFGLVLGQAQTQPGPTRGHPYLWVWVLVKTVENFGSDLVCWVSGCWVAGFGFVDGDGMGGRRRLGMGDVIFNPKFYFLFLVAKKVREKKKENKI